MTNKFKRSVTAVLLAAAMVLSSQGVIAFADYGTNSDVSELPPVQEDELTVGESAPMAAPMMMSAPMPMNQPEDGDKTSTITINSSLLYTWDNENNKAEKIHDDILESRLDNLVITCDGEHSDEGMHHISKSALLELIKNNLPENYTVTNAWIGHDNSGNHGENVYWTQGGGEKLFLEYTVNGNPGTGIPDPDTDDGWKSQVTVYLDCDDCDQCDDNCPCDPEDGDEDEDDIDPSFTLENLTKNDGLYDIIVVNNTEVTVSFSNYGSAWASHFDTWLGDQCKCGGHTYDHFDDNHSTITLNWNGNKWVVSDRDSIEIDVLCNEKADVTWTFNTDGNGQVKWNDGKSSDSISFDTNLIKDIGPDDYIYTVPNEGYVFSHWTGADFVKNDKVALGNLSKEKNFTVTAHFLPADPENPEIDVKVLDLGVKFDCADKPNEHNTTEPYKLGDHELSEGYYTVDKATGTVTIKAKKYLEDYNTDHAGHRLVNPNEEYKIQLTLVDNTWTVAEEQKIVTIPVTCKAEVKQITDLKIHIGDKLSEKYSGTIPVLGDYKLGYYGWFTEFHAEYGPYPQFIYMSDDGEGTFNPTPVAGLIPSKLTTEYDTIPEVQSFFQGFTYQITPTNKPYIDNSYIVNVTVEGTTLHITLEIPENPEEKPTKPDYKSIQALISCSTDLSHTDTVRVSELKADEFTSTWSDETTPNEVIVTLNNDKIQANYVNSYKPGQKKHTIVNNEYSVTLKWLPIDESGNYGWTVEGKPVTAEAPATIDVETTCLPDLDTSKIGVDFICVNDDSHAIASRPLSEFYRGSHTITYSTDENGKPIVTVTLNSDKLNLPEGHIYVSTSANTSESNSIVFQFKEEQRNWDSGSEKNQFTVAMLCAPTEAEVRDMGLGLTLDCITTNGRHNPQTFNLSDTNIPITISAAPSSVMPISDEVSYNVFVGVDTEYCLAQYNATHGTHTYAANNPEAIFVLEWSENSPIAEGRWTPCSWKPVSPTSLKLDVEHEVTNPPVDPTDPGTNPGGNTGNNDDDDDNDVEVSNFPRIRLPGTTTIDDEDVPLADLPTDDTVTIDDGEVPLKDNPETGDALPVAALAAAALSLGGVVVLNRKKK